MPHIKNKSKINSSEILQIYFRSNLRNFFVIIMNKLFDDKGISSPQGMVLGLLSKNKAITTNGDDTND